MIRSLPSTLFILALALLSRTAASATVVEEQLPKDAKRMLRSDPKEHRLLGLFSVGLNFMLGRQFDGDCTPAPGDCDTTSPTSPAATPVPSPAPSIATATGLPTRVPTTSVPTTSVPTTSVPTTSVPTATPPVGWALGALGQSCNDVCTGGDCNVAKLAAVTTGFAVDYALKEATESGCSSQGAAVSAMDTFVPYVGGSSACKYSETIAPTCEASDSAAQRICCCSSDGTACEIPMR